MAYSLPTSVDNRAVLVCGGRDFDDREWLFRILDAMHRVAPFKCLIEGGQVSLDPAEDGLEWTRRRKWGADYFAKQWAGSRAVRVVTFKADWRQFGKKAGPIRNQQMLDEGKPGLVVAFPGGWGTADMLRRAKKAGVDWMALSRAPCAHA
jgi:hypothetical protein